MHIASADLANAGIAEAVATAENKRSGGKDFFHTDRTIVEQFVIIVVEDGSQESFGFLDLFCVGIESDGAVLFFAVFPALKRELEAGHDEAEDVDGLLLSDAMAAGDGLVFDGRVPVGADKVDLAEVLEVQTLAAGLYLQDEDVAFLGDDTVALGGQGATVEGLHAKTFGSEPGFEGVDFPAVVTEEELGPAVVLTVEDLLDDGVELAGRSGGLIQRGVVFDGARADDLLYLAVEEGRADAHLPGAQQGNKGRFAANPVGKRERVWLGGSGVERKGARNDPAEVEARMDIGGESPLGIVGPRDQDGFAAQGRQGEAGLLLGAPQDEGADDVTEVVGVEVVIRWDAQDGAHAVEVIGGVLDGSAGDEPANLRLELEGAQVNLGCAIAHMVCFVEDNAAPLDLVEEGKTGLTRGDHTIGGNDDVGVAQHGEGDVVLVGTVVDKGAMLEGGAKDAVPLLEEGARKDDEGAAHGVAQHDANDLHGLAEAHFVGNESAAYEAGAGTGSRIANGVPVELVGQAPLDAVELVGVLVEAGVFEIAMKLVDIRHRMVARRFNAQMSSKGNCVMSER